MFISHSLSFFEGFVMSVSMIINQQYTNLNMFYNNNKKWWVSHILRRLQLMELRVSSLCVFVCGGDVMPGAVKKISYDLAPDRLTQRPVIQMNNHCVLASPLNEESSYFCFQT